MDKIYSILEANSNEVIINKSRFIANLIPVTNLLQVQQSLTEIKNSHPKANHHCYAYIIGSNKNYQKFDDDNEPSGSAGLPILNILQHANLTNILIIVTRYFGGIKLGMGGLIRAYQAAAKEVIAKSPINIQELYNLYYIETDYTMADKIKNYLQQKITISNIEYLAHVKICFFAKSQDQQTIENELSNILSMQLSLHYLGTDYI